MMRILAILLVLTAVACETSPSQSSTLSSSDLDELKGIQTNDWVKGYQGDTAVLGNILHERFQLTDDQGDTYKKSDEMNYAASQGGNESFSFEILKVEGFDNGSAYVFGQGKYVGTKDDLIYTRTYKCTNTFIKEGGKWQAISSHVSGVKEE